MTFTLWYAMFFVWTLLLLVLRKPKSHKQCSGSMSSNFDTLDQHNTDFNPFIKQVECQAFHPKHKSEVGGPQTIQIWSRTYEALKRNDLWWPKKLLEGHKYPQLVKGLNLAKQKVSRTGDEQHAHECVHCEAKSIHARERQTVSRFRRS